MTPLPKPLREKMEELAGKCLSENLPPMFKALEAAGIQYSDEQLGLISDDMFKAGFQALYTHLMESAVEFDEKAARLYTNDLQHMLGVKGDTWSEIQGCLVDVARWQHTQSQASVAALRAENESLKMAAVMFKASAEQAIEQMNADGFKEKITKASYIKMQTDYQQEISALKALLGEALQITEKYANLPAGYSVGSLQTFRMKIKQSLEAK